MTQQRVDHLGNLRVTELGDARIWAAGDVLVEAVTIAETLSGDTFNISDVVAETFTVIDSYTTDTDLTGTVVEAVTIADTLTGETPAFAGTVVETVAIVDALGGGINAIGAIIETVVIRDGFISPDDLGGSANSPIIEIPGVWIQEVLLRGRSVRPFV